MNLRKNTETTFSNKRGSTYQLTQVAIIAAIYAAITLALLPMSYGPLQVRVSEALTILPFFTKAAIPGLTIGCLIANLIGPNGTVDVIFGTLATLIASIITYKIRVKWLAPMPAVIVNGLIIGTMLHFVLAIPLIPTIFWVGVGEFIAVYGIGYPLMIALEKYKERLF